MELNKLSKTELINIASKHQAVSQEALNIANYLYSNITQIDDKISQLTPPTKGIKLGWIWKNRVLLLEIIEFIIARIKEVKDKIKEINEKNAQPSGSPE